MAVPTFTNLPINSDWVGTKVVDWAKTINDSTNSGFVSLNTFISNLLTYLGEVENELTWIEEA